MLYSCTHTAEVGVRGLTVKNKHLQNIIVFYTRCSEAGGHKNCGENRREAPRSDEKYYRGLTVTSARRGDRHLREADLAEALSHRDTGRRHRHLTELITGERRTQS